MKPTHGDYTSNVSTLGIVCISVQNLRVWCSAADFLGDNITIHSLRSVNGNRRIAFSTTYQLDRDVLEEKTAEAC